MYAAINEGSIIKVGLDAGYKFNYRRICLELMLGIGTGSIKHESDFNSYRIPAEYSRVLNDEKKFYRAEVSRDICSFSGKTMISRMEG
jgi:hypothetical protein